MSREFTTVVNDQRKSMLLFVEILQSMYMQCSIWAEPCNRWKLCRAQYLVHIYMLHGAATCTHTSCPSNSTCSPSPTNQALAGWQLLKLRMLSLPQPSRCELHSITFHTLPPAGHGRGQACAPTSQMAQMKLVLNEAMQPGIYQYPCIRFNCHTCLI